MVEQAERLGLDFIASLSGGNAEKAAGLFGENATYSNGGPVRGRQVRGKAAIRDFFSMVLGDVFSGLTFNIKKVLATEKTAFIACTDEAVIKITGRKYKNEVVFLVEVKDGKIESIHEYLDTMAGAMAVGDLAPDAASGTG